MAKGVLSLRLKILKKDTNIENISDKRYKMNKRGMRQNYNEETTKYLD
jgi:hypothetical protein